jgi:hypothetical protein
MIDRAGKVAPSTLHNRPREHLTAKKCPKISAPPYVAEVGSQGLHQGHVLSSTPWTPMERAFS